MPGHKDFLKDQEKLSTQEAVGIIPSAYIMWLHFMEAAGTSQDCISNPPEQSDLRRRSEVCNINKQIDRQTEWIPKEELKDVKKGSKQTTAAHATPAWN